MKKEENKNIARREFLHKNLIYSYVNEILKQKQSTDEERNRKKKIVIEVEPSEHEACVGVPQ